MAGIIKGVQAIKSATESKPRAEFNWFKLEDNAAVKVKFLQELDYDADGYDEEKGVGFMVVVFEPPVKDGWKYRYKLEEEDEHLLPELGDWNRKTRLYINLLVNRGTDEEPDWKVEVWDASKTVAKQLVEYSNEMGGLTDGLWKIRRSGTGRETSYLFMSIPDKTDVNTDEYDTVNVEDRIFTRLTEEEIARWSSDEEDTSDSVGFGWDD